MAVRNYITHDYQIETYRHTTNKKTTKDSNIDPSNLNEKSFESTPNETITPLKKRSLDPIVQKRTEKKHMHTKICTALGVRDRRMRLSLQVRENLSTFKTCKAMIKHAKPLNGFLLNRRRRLRSSAKTIQKIDQFYQC
ncbi:transcription factor CYCLOIDEA-like [Forsythia ovata]|uniref:Transcription factor CYCLOIDEA-like n=1 Tax=Forsythia ovata TaxID=205694 RepID=A0ABD1U6F1_9LAMI